MGAPSIVRSISLHPQVTEDSKASLSAVAPIRTEPPAARHHDRSHPLQACDIQGVQFATVDEDSGTGLARGV